MPKTPELPEPPPLEAIFEALSKDERKTLNQFVETVHFPAGHCIFRAGSAADGCYLIDEGVVRLELERSELDTDGTLAFIEAGALLGELAVLDGLPRTVSAHTETDVSARFISSRAIDELTQTHPAVGLALFRAFGRDVAHKLRRTNERLSEFISVGTHDPLVDDMVARSRAAQKAIEGWGEERIDALLLALASEFEAHAEELAAATVSETKVGNIADKTIKNRIASMGVYHTLKGRIGNGPIRDDPAREVVEIASPMGVVFAIVPMTNPVATAIFKTLICLKSRNAVILSFHRACLGVGNTAGQRIRAVLDQAGAPPDLVQWVKSRGSRKTTARFMSHRDVALILATGGPGLVKAAYSSGKPALGVGAGNTPTLICRDADIEAAAQGTVGSKSFDNGLICGAEHNLVVDQTVRDAFIAALERNGAAVLTPAESDRFIQTFIVEGHFHPRIVGQSGETLAKAMDLRREKPVRVIVVPGSLDFASPLSGEKMAPILSLFTVADAEEGFALCQSLLAHQGAGHTAIIYSADRKLTDRFGLEIPASRILVNSAGVPGICGMTSGLVPSFTLGCGTFGGNSTTDSVTYSNLLNIKRLARFHVPAAPM